MLFDYFVQLDKDKDNKVRQRQPYLAELLLSRLHNLPCPSASEHMQIRVSEVLEGYKDKSLKLPMNSTDFIRVRVSQWLPTHIAQPLLFDHSHPLHTCFADPGCQP